MGRFDGDGAFNLAIPRMDPGADALTVADPLFEGQLRDKAATDRRMAITEQREREARIASNTYREKMYN